MAGKSTTKKNQLTKSEDIRLDKISVFFKRPILKNIVKMLTMEHAGYRSFKAVKNINTLFNNLDVSKYKNNIELEAYLWCIKFISKKWLDGYVTPDLIAEVAKRDPEYDNVKEEIITACMNDKNVVTAPEARGISDLISEALQYGYITSLKDEYINLLEDIDLTDPGAFKELARRLFMVSKSLLDIQHNTNLVGNKVSFNTGDLESVRNALSQTITSLSTTGNMLKTGIRRLNTLLSPAYMNGRLYVYAGAVGSGKSVILQKSALDIREYNPGYVTKTPGMRPCVLYISMENTFTECIERMWNMSFDDPITNFTEEQALEMLCDKLGMTKVLRDDVVVKDLDTGEKSLAELLDRTPKDDRNIEIVMQYYPYREISTDDLFTIVQDLREENLEVCALVFDYIKRIRPSVVQADNEKMELNRIMNELKAFAVIMDMPVITAHQLNRNAVSIMDQASRQGKGDVAKLVGREHIGTAWEVAEVADWLGIVNIEYKPGTDERYLEVNVVKRRRIDAAEAEFAKFTYLAHPFAKNNGLRLLDDMRIDKVLSLQSLTSDINLIGKEKANATKRLQTMEPSEFIDLDEDY